MKLVSVVIASYNAARFLPTTLQSVFEQSYGAMEIVLVDDGSSDDTQSVLDGLTDPRLRHTRIEHSGGPSRPRNVGIQLARGDYICFFDADDVMCPDKIEGEMQLLTSEPDLGLVFTDYDMIDERGILQRASVIELHDFFQRIESRPATHGLRLNGASAYRWLMRANYIGTSSVVMTRHVLDTVGSFDESLFVAEDMDLWYRVARHYDLGFMPTIMHHYRRHVDGISQQNKPHQMASRIEVNRRMLAQPVTAKIRRDILRQRASFEREHAYHWELMGHHRQARLCYLNSLWHCPSPPAIGGLIKTCIPPAILGGLKGVRKGRRSARQDQVLR